MIKPKFSRGEAVTSWARYEGREGGSCDIMGEIRGSRGPFQRDGGEGRGSD